MRWNDLSWLKSNRILLVSQIVGVPLVIGWFLFFYFDTHSPVALVLLALIPVSAVVNLVIINRRRGRLADPAARRDTLTGEVVPPISPLQMPLAEIHQQRWTGAVDMPGSMGRMNASVPLGILELSGNRITLRVRPAFLATMFGSKPLIVTPAQVEVVFPARGRLRYRAIGIRPRNEPPCYFLLGGDRQFILSAIAAAGFHVQWEERVYSYG